LNRDVTTTHDHTLTAMWTVVCGDYVSAVRYLQHLNDVAVTFLMSLTRDHGHAALQPVG